MDLTGLRTEKSQERDGRKPGTSTAAQAGSKAPDILPGHLQPTNLGSVYNGLNYADISVGGRFFWSQNPVRGYPLEGMSPSGTARGMGGSTEPSGYYQGTPGDSFPTAATSSLRAQTTSASIPQVYRQPGLDGRSAGNVPAIQGMSSQAAPATEVRREKEQSVAAGFGEAFTPYQSALNEIFQNIQGGVLATASDSLLEASHWLLSRVVELGLASDDQIPEDERIKLWENFNYAWLAIFQRQKEMMKPGQQLQHGQTLVPQEGLQKMGDDLVRLCESIAQYGLVDYQQGVWEEQIIDILKECLDLYKSSPE